MQSLYPLPQFAEFFHLLVNDKSHAKNRPGMGTAVPSHVFHGTCVKTYSLVDTTFLLEIKFTTITATMGDL